TRLDAQALAETLIKDNEKDPMWSQGSRALLVGLVSDLQARHGTRWGMAHLAHAAAAALGDFATLKAIIGREDPLSLSLLGGDEAEGPNRTTMGFLVQLAAALTQVINLGVASYDLRDNAEWSVRSWLAGRQPPVAVLGFRDSARSLSQAFASSLIEQTVRQVSDMPDAAPDQRRIWLIVDEAPRVGKVPSITDALAAARSKGLRVVLGIQSLAQVRETYTRDTATTWAGQTATKIICQTTAPDDQEWCAKLLGDREVDRFQHQVATQTGRDGGQHNQSWQRVREPVLMPAAFGRDLKVIKGRGPRALLMAGGEAALLQWPFPTLQTHRPDRLEARWIQQNYQRPAWGKAPPEVGRSPAPAPPAPVSKKQPEKEPLVQAMGTPRMDRETPHPMPAVTPDAGLTDPIPDLVLDHLAPGLGLFAKILGPIEAVSTPSPAPPALGSVPPPGSAGPDDRDGGEEGQDEEREP
ncbi:MAG: type IV secretion system DNA-binding domain-containing protein, partial [Gammaproteobacteria bacterium]|nr:type IV secretion system DNA-binding domain-containing protein [Gammaproteobacteria bacterium]